NWDWITRPLREDTPIPAALTAYTDAGKKSRTATVTWHQKDIWKHKILQAEERDSLQTLELLAVVWALTNLKEPLNIVTDSLYVAGVVARIEDSSIKEVQNKRLCELLL
ncbi:POK19 protein, partial [Notiomystis cincta]|nr:POK19 protein [Notiomystis cincta]